MSKIIKPKIVIRASSLPSLADCMRRTAYRSFGGRESYFGGILEDAGFGIPERERSGSAAAVGTAAHAFSMEILDQGMKGETRRIEMAKEAANASIEKELIDRGIEWDSEIPNKDNALKLVMLLGATFLDIADSIEPMNLEQELVGVLSQDTKSDIILSGHLDIRENDLRIRDLKFGKKAAGYQFQLGGYAILSKANQIETSGLTIDHIPRNKSGKPIYKRADYDTKACAQEAFRLINRTVDAIRKFEEGGNPSAFPANPSSTLCTPKWCPAFGTAFCKLGEEFH